LSSYLSNTTYLEIKKGSLDFVGNLNYQGGKLNLEGTSSAHDFDLTSPSGSFLSFQKLVSPKLVYKFPENSFVTDGLIFHGLKSFILLKADGTLNYKEIMKPAKVVTKPAPAKKSKSFYEIKKLEFIDSGLSYTDQQIKPSFKTEINKLNGTIAPIESTSLLPIKIDLKGQVEAFGKFEASGKYQASKKDLDLKAQFNNIELTTFTPYAGKFMGYEIKKGKLFLEIAYTLIGEKIQGKNSVRLDQFKLGREIDSKDAPNIPLAFVVSLLQDRKGQIKFRLPVEGTTQDPKFSMGSMIRTALFNMFVNIVMSPFDFLADLLGIDKEVKQINFQPFTLELKEADLKKFSDLKKIMDEKDDLRIEIMGTVSRLEIPEKVKLENDEPLMKMALARAEVIQKKCVEAGINPERVFIQASKINDDSKGPPGGILQLSGRK
jgi:hypothetical protein